MSNQDQSLWQECLQRLERQYPLDEINTWLRPLRLTHGDDKMLLCAPNHIVCNRVRELYLPTIEAILAQLGVDPEKGLELTESSATPGTVKARRSGLSELSSGLYPNYTFNKFVQGKSNEIALGAALQVAQNPGRVYNPLTLYGSTGLGKTHLLHAAGHMIKQHNPQAVVVYLTSEQFVSQLVNALSSKNINQFKNQYRQVDTLLIDDIQFIAGKDRSQEEFFHTFNALVDLQQQIILTCDRYPKEISNLEERIQSRLGWGLAVSIEPPDYETRVAILVQKARDKNWEINNDVAGLLASKVRSSVRDLEGALNTLYANAHFKGVEITVDFARETLRDLLSIHDRMISVDMIKKKVVEFYHLRESDMVSKKRSRSIARPRQLAMSLSKELTDLSLPDIGQAFGGRDHTTVMHACRKIEQLMREDPQLAEDRRLLTRSLTG